jgi:CheY-like chemotaxis protein
MKNPRHTSGVLNERRKDGLRVLCAEDDEPLAVMLKHALERAGHHVEHVPNGQEAFDRIRANVAFFDLLVTDHEMPSLGGLALVEKLRSLPFAGAIIVHSSPLREPDATAYRQLSVTHIISKPARLSEFLAIVREVRAIAS